MAPGAKQELGKMSLSRHWFPFSLIAADFVTMHWPLTSRVGDSHETHLVNPHDK